MTERLIIENFGGLKAVELEIRAINVLIGPQASGKSVIVKLIYFFKTFFDEAFNSIFSEETPKQFIDKQKERFVNYFPIGSWSVNAFKIDFFINDAYITISKQDASAVLSIAFSEDVKNVMAAIRDVVKEDQKKVDKGANGHSARLYEAMRVKFEKNLNVEFPGIFSFNQYFIPAGRSFFANIQSSIFSLLRADQSIDPFLLEFGSFYERFKRMIAQSSRETEELNELTSEIIGVNYLKENDKEYLIHPDSRKVNLANASSGQQEILPLIIILKALTAVRGGTLYIEEPEAHLFPDAQKRIIRLLVKIFHSSGQKLQIFITTHSPYILASLNNLMEAGKVLKEHESKKDELFKVIPKDEIIEPGTLIAYSLKDGEKELLIDESSQLIYQNLLDSVSDEISIEFGKLLDLEF